MGFPIIVPHIGRRHRQATGTCAFSTVVHSPNFYGCGCAGEGMKTKTGSNSSIRLDFLLFCPVFV
jgi:hypothetical protein